MKEEFVSFPSTNESSAFTVILAGISYCDNTYHIKRTNAPYAVIEYIMEGEGDIITNGKIYHAEKGDMYLLPKGSNHVYYSSKNNPWIKIWVQIKGRIAHSLIREYNLKEQILFKNLDGYDFLLNIHKIGKSDNLNAMEKHQKASLVFHELLLLMSNHNNNNNNNISDDCKKIKNFIDNNYTSNITLETIAEEIHFSHTHIIRVFKKEIQMTPYQYLLNLRIDHAKHLLQNTSIKIKDICQLAGFFDQNYFSYIFKNKTGLSPKQFRNQESLSIASFMQ